MLNKSVVYKLFIILVAFTLIAPVSTLAGSSPAPATSGSLAPLAPTATTVTEYFDGRQAAMALNFDTELYLCGMIHSANGYDPATAAARSQKTRVGWPNLIQDAETYQIPLSFNICGHEAVFGDTGRTETAALDVTYNWADPHWATNTWYSDKPQNGGNYLTTGDLSGTTRSYGLIYGGDMTEQALNSSVPFEISYHNFGHESLSNLSSAEINATFGLGVQYHRRIGNKIRAEAPPWNNNPSTASYPVYLQNGIFVFNRSEGPMQDPYEDDVIDNLWIIPRAGAFNASTDFRSTIDTAITNGVVFADYSHPEDGFDSSNRSAFQTSLAYAQTKVASGELWATTLSEIGRYWEAKSIASISEINADGKTIVDVTLPGYNAALFGIPYLTFQSPMPNVNSFARITVDFPSSQVLNSNSSTVRVVDGQVTYSIYLNPTGTTHVEIEGVEPPFTGGVDINTPVLSIDSNATRRRVELLPRNHSSGSHQHGCHLFH